MAEIKKCVACDTGRFCVGDIVAINTVFDKNEYTGRIADIDGNSVKLDVSSKYNSKFITVFVSDILSIDT